MKKKVIIEIEVETNSTDRSVDQVLRSRLEFWEALDANAYIINPQIVQIDIYPIENENS